ncbi:MAG: prepilin-type N-terminal cleavage/methylation domain-containing protein [Candidatus Gastranaerophilales bacterium]|nr:prepilin-type N-terminal cleavage/methylation domain-containing protein [Candidatus Gastranaerophilales bacterium]
MKKNKAAFTLAETLIVIAIIGIIAGITIPMLFGGSNDAELKAAFKKMYGEMTQVYNLVTFENGTPYKCTYLTSGGSIRTECYEMYNAMLSKMNYIKKCEISSYSALGTCIVSGGVIYSDGTESFGGCAGYSTANQNASLSFVLNNGMYVFVYGAADPHPLFAIDVNGFKGPNNWGKDVFGFQIKDNKIINGGCVTGSVANQTDILSGAD